MLRGFRGRFVYAGGIGLLVAAVAVPALAGVQYGGRSTPSCTDTWMGGNGDWTNAAHWSNGVPGPGTDACLPAGSYVVTIIGESVQTGTLTVGAGVTLSLQISGCGATSAILTLNGDMGNAGEVDLANPGDACGGTAQVVVPPGSTLTNDGTIATFPNRGDR